MSKEQTKIDGILPQRPKPIVTELEVLEYAAHIPAFEAVKALMANQYILIVDNYSSGLLVVDELKKQLRKHKSNITFSEQRKGKQLFRTLSHRILMEIEDHQLLVKKAPKIGWLKKLYSDIDHFFLPFPEIQGLNSSWQWYEKGISIPQLNEKIYPFYGTYFPTRFDHLELMVRFLSKYNGSKQTAIDIGIGSGVLSYLLQEHGFEQLIGTDANANAIIGVREHLIRQIKPDTIQLRTGDLFANSNKKFDLIVFNPPWIPMAGKQKGIDAAMYYDKELFPRFFDKASSYLQPNGQIVLIFSNLAQLMDEKNEHPIALELKHNNRFKKVELLTKKVNPQSEKTKRQAQWRDEEIVELWVLEAK